MKQAIAADNWMQEQRQRMAEKLKKEGFIAYDEFGQAHLTLKGKQRAADRLDKLPIGDDLLIEIAVCESYHTTASI